MEQNLQLAVRPVLGSYSHIQFLIVTESIIQEKENNKKKKHIRQIFRGFESFLGSYYRRYQDNFCSELEVKL